MPISPFKSSVLTYVFEKSLKVTVPLTIAIVYFTLVHIFNPIVLRRQLKQAGLAANADEKMSDKELKRLKPAPYKIASYKLFKILVFFHNVFLFVYSVWTFVGMLGSFSRTVSSIRMKTSEPSRFLNFVYAVCDLENGVFKQNSEDHNLTMYGWWFYMLKFYEVIDTIIILLKGKPSSMLQSYHHSGAMMCMWSGIRYTSPPIWIFVVFNSFIHLFMYLYFSLCSIRVRVPVVLKRGLTALQILQFIVGGLIAVFHAFVWYTDLSSNNYSSCIATSDQAVSLIVNVGYLAPLTALFAAFYIESYRKRKAA